jgi:sirohydrochlorin ferrochelatase
MDHLFSANFGKGMVLLCLMLGVFIAQIQAQSTGVLILAHGGSEEWNQAVVEAAKPLKEDHHVEIAFGMANAVTMQNGIKSLEDNDVSEIVVVPLFISSHSPIISQTEYLLGLRNELADDPMPLMHHVDEYLEMVGKETPDSSRMRHGMLFPENLQPLSVDTKVIITQALDDHDVVAQILYDRISELSENPADETVLLVAHGPNQENDNEKWIENMESLSRKIQKTQKKNGDGFKQIFAFTVRDDAPNPIFNQAKQQLRALVRQADQFGDVIVVPLFLSSGGREDAVAERLSGLDFKWNGKTLLPDPKISNFLVNSVEKALENSQQSEME